MTETAPRSGKELKGWHVLFIMLAFFGVMFAVNGVFLYYAITSHPGEQVEKSYLQGLNYNDTLDVRARQAEAGWKGAIGIIEQDGAAPLLMAQIADADEQPLSGLALQASLHRHTTSDATVKLDLALTGSGEYSAPLEGLPAGNYDVIITATDSGEGEILFEAHKRLYLP